MKLNNINKTYKLILAGSLLVNLLYIGYFWLVQPVVLARLNSAISRDRPDTLLGGILLVVQVLEFAGLLLKRPEMAYWASNYPRQDRQNWRIFLIALTPVLHLSAACMLVLPTFNILGIGFGQETPGGIQALLLVVFFLVLIKEAFFVTMMMPYGSIPPAADTPTSRKLARLEQFLVGKPAKEINLKVLLKSWVGDVLLLCYSAPAYTLIWVYTLQQEQPTSFLAYLGFSVYFLMVYAATRGVYLLQNSAVEMKKSQRWASGISFMLIWVSALFNIPKA